MATDFTIADVLAWARTKPADELYSFFDAGACAIAQFGKATGREYLIDVGDLDEAMFVPRELVRAVNCQEAECTFGQLVARLETLCPETPVTKSDWLAIDTYLNADCGEQVA